MHDHPLSDLEKLFWLFDRFENKIEIAEGREYEPMLELVLYTDTSGAVQETKYNADGDYIHDYIIFDNLRDGIAKLEELLEWKN